MTEVRESILSVIFAVACLNFGAMYVDSTGAFGGATIGESQFNQDSFQLKDLLTINPLKQIENIFNIASIIGNFISWMVAGFPKLAIRVGLDPTFAYAVYVGAFAFVIALVLFRNHMKKAGIEI